MKSVFQKQGIRAPNVDKTNLRNSLYILSILGKNQTANKLNSKTFNKYKITAINTNVLRTKKYQNVVLQRSVVTLLHRLYINFRFFFYISLKMDRQMSLMLLMKSSKVDVIIEQQDTNLEHMQSMTGESLFLKKNKSLCMP